MNTAGAEAGLRLHYDRTAVAHWISGSRPQGQVPALIAEVLTRRLGRPVTMSEIGLDDSDATKTLHSDSAGGITALIELAQNDLNPASHDILARSIYRLDALAVPPYPVPGRALHHADVVQHRAQQGILTHQSSLAHHVAAVFAAASHQFGSGHIRTALTVFLAHDVLPTLAASDTEIAHRELLGAAADLALLIGFMCFDSNEHGLAQRYYRTAIDLAVLRHDAVRYAIGLRAISQQACHLRHAPQALRLALAALTTGSDLAPPHTNAFLHAQVSLCYATVGDRAAALAHHHSARDSLSRATSKPPPFGAYHRGELAYHAAAIRTFSGDTFGAITSLNSALRHYPAAERRSRALALAALAERQLDVGLLSHACNTAYRFLDEYPRLCSGRVTTAMRTLGSRLQQFRSDPAARGLLLKGFRHWTAGD